MKIYHLCILSFFPPCISFCIHFSLEIHNGQMRNIFGVIFLIERYSFYSKRSMNAFLSTLNIPSSFDGGRHLKKANIITYKLALRALGLAWQVNPFHQQTLTLLQRHQKIREHTIEQLPTKGEHVVTKLSFRLNTLSNI